MAWQDDVAGAVKSGLDTLDPIQHIDRGINGGMGKGYKSPSTGYFDNYINDNYDVPGSTSDELVPPSEEELIARRRNQTINDTLKANIAAAQKFRQDVPNYQGNLSRDIDTDARANIARGQQQVRRQAQNRGLLHSGYRTAGESGVATKGALDASRQKQKIGGELEQMARGLEDQAIKMGMDKQLQDMETADQIYDLALDQARQRAASLTGFLSAGGAAAGRAASSE